MIFFFFQGSWFRNRDVRYLIFLKAVINTIPMIQMGPSTWWDTKCISLFHDCNPCWQPCTSALRLEISTLSSLYFPWKHLWFFFCHSRNGLIVSVLLLTFTFIFWRRNVGAQGEGVWNERNNFEHRFNMMLSLYAKPVFYIW